MAAAARPTSEITLLPSSTPSVERLQEVNREKFLEACDKGRSEVVESVLNEEVTQDDRTALANTKSMETGFTPLHRVCHHGHHQCISPLLKQKADAHIWDHCGFAPIHCAARGNHIQCVTLLLQSGACHVNEKTEFGENPFVIACLNGSVTVARALYEEYKCGVPEVDSRGNSLLHYASASDSAELLLWLLSIHEVKVHMDSPNNKGHTPLHIACVLGCVHSLSALLRHDVSVSNSLTPSSSSQPHTLTPSQLALKLGNRNCYEILENSATPPPLPRVPTTASSLYRQGSHNSDDQLKPTAEALSLPPPLRSNSSSSRGSRQSILSTTSTSHQRRGSLVAGGRPVTLELRRSSSLRKGSSETLLKQGGEEDRRTYLPDRTNATRLSQSLSRLSSTSLEQLLYDSTAYEPPPDILFTPPVERKVLTIRVRKVYSSEHGLKMRVSQTYWTGENKSHGLHICMCAAMHYSQTFPQGYMVVSPICFLSCRSRGPCQVNLSLPHAVDIKGETLPELVILSSATARTDPDAQSPFFSPSERALSPLEGLKLKIQEGLVQFQTELCNPSLFAVAVRESPGSIPLPLKCCLYVLYPGFDSSIAMLTTFDVETYIGMNLQTVATAMVSWADNHKQKLEEAHFTMSEDQVTVQAHLLPLDQTDWVIGCRGEGKLKYSQVSLTQHTDRDVYSHQLVYPRRERFFVEPKSASSAVKCRITLHDSTKELCSLFVIPYSPKKEATPDLSSPEHRLSLPVNNPRPPATRRHSLPSSTTATIFSQQTSPVHSPSHFPQVLLSTTSSSNSSSTLPHGSHSASAIQNHSPLLKSAARPSPTQSPSLVPAPKTTPDQSSSATASASSRPTTAAATAAAAGGGRYLTLPNGDSHHSESQV